jgi:glutamyl/glutaminyl-tRNA synthetase
MDEHSQRLNVDYTITSKRKLRKLVEGAYVNGWDDPRMPTVVGPYHAQQYFLKIDEYRTQALQHQQYRQFLTRLHAYNN